MAQHLQQSFAAVEERNVELHQLNQLKDEFLANTSHELKTPIQGIIGLAETLLDNKEMTPHQQKNLLTIIHSGYRLSNLVNDILDFSRLRHRDIELNCQAVNFRSLTDVVIILSKPLLENKPVNLNNAISNNLPLVYGDENRLQQILHNLIGNAIKFTEKGDITVSATIRSKSHDVVIKVRDTGVGIATDSLQRIFEAFEQADGSTSRTYGGTGLGLAITRRLVELHGGQIWADSTPDKGSTFYFSLPLARNQEASAEITSSRIHSILSTPILLSEPSLEEKQNENNQGETLPNSHYAAHILVVDDEALNRRVLINHLHSHRYQVTEANSGKVALELLENGLQPDLVLLDVMMPNMTGYQVTEILRQRWQADELPIVLLTAKSQISDIILGLETGANDYLTKPISKEELLARLKTHLNLRELRQEKQRLEFRQAQFLEAMPIGVKILEVNGQPYYNNSQAAYLGLDFSLPVDNEPIKNLYRSGTDMLYPPHQLPLLKARQGESAYADDLEIRQNNRCVALECWSAPVFENNEIHYIIATFQDITARKQAEQELRANETRFRQLMEAMSAAVAIVEADGAVLYSNRATEELTGYSTAALQQLKLWELVHPDYRDKMIAPKQVRLDDKFLPVRYELPIVNYQHHTRWLDITARKIDYQGKAALIINALDITERKTTTELLNNIASGLMSYTGKNFLLSLVEYLVHTLQVDCVFIAQYFPTQYGEQMTVDFISAGHSEPHLEKFTYQLKGTASFEVIHHQHLYTCQENAWQFFPQDLLLQSLAAECFIGTPLLSANGNLQGLMAIVNCQPLENYTLHESALRIFAARAAAELERQAALETLEAERASLAAHVQERTSELSRANIELARAARLKDEFLANMSHELRTPLNAILGLSEALLEGAFGSLSETQHRSLAVLLESGRHLLELINDILDLAKIEANKIQLCLSEVFLREVCESSLRLIQEMASKKRISLYSSFDPEITLVSVDARRLKQILVNLLSNAVKFTPDGGKVYLTTQGVKETQKISISIRDTGIGMRAMDLPRLFRPFEQLDGGLDRAHEGTGLGLALVQRLVIMHNGTIEVESELNRGSCFTIYLPWIVPEMQMPIEMKKNVSVKTLSTLSSVEEHARILLVDDNPINVKTFEEYLTSRLSHYCGA
jgi:PAS domain S-box-containing protein